MGPAKEENTKKNIVIPYVMHGRKKGKNCYKEKRKH
jgi:hypothetical protein